VLRQVRWPVEKTEESTIVEKSEADEVSEETKSKAATRVQSVFRRFRIVKEVMALRREDGKLGVRAK
jgi:hypothetical protein